MQLNKEFTVAADFVNYTSEHIFLTGKAGTGKTTFLKHIIQHCHKKLVVTAPTGVAAINAGGVTLHSLFQLPLGTFIADYKKNWGFDQDNFIINRHQLLSKIRINAKKRTLLKELELLIIDEISMVRSDLLDAIDTLLRHIRKRSDVPFGGVQLLMIGDLYQLPPVVKQYELSVMNDHYNSPFFFDATALADCAPITIELKTIYRQDDEDFINLLNNIRNNVVDEQDYQLLHTRYFPQYEASSQDNIITLTSHNATADDINGQQLESLDSEPHLFDATVDGEFPESLYPIDFQLQFKIGAQIMFVKNDMGEERRFYNGKLGIIEAIDLEENSIKINFPKDKESMWIGREKWENVKYRFLEEKEQIDTEVVGTFQQFPFKLAWAVTIHKSQGLTFDEAIIDAGRSFAAGQVYVALSRMTSMQGMILKSRILPSSISVDERIVRYMNAVKKVELYHDRLQMGKMEFLLSKIKASFKWHDQWEEWLATNESKLSAIADELLMMSDGYTSAKSQIIHWDTIGLSFTRQVEYLISIQDWAELAARMEAAHTWFTTQWDTVHQPMLVSWIHAIELMKNSNTAAKAIAYYIRRLNSLLAQMSAATEAIKDYATHQDITQALAICIAKPATEQTTSEPKLSVKEPNKKGSTKDISLRLFREGKSVAEIATVRGLTQSTIIGHLSDGIKDGSISPDSFIEMNKLLQIVDKITQHPDEKWGQQKALFDDSVSYDDLKIANAYKEYLDNKKKENTG